MLEFFKLLFYSITIKYIQITPLAIFTFEYYWKHTHIYDINLWEIQLKLKFYQGNLVPWKNLFFISLGTVAKSSSENKNRCIIDFEEAFLSMSSLCTFKESKKQIPSVRLCPWGIQFTLFFANWPSLQRRRQS